jgi:hypothetical protein
MRTEWRTLLVVMAAGAAMCCGRIAGAQELRNGSFEDAEAELDNAYGDLAAHWGRWGNWMNRETAWRPTHQGKSIIGYHHWQIEGGDSSGIYQDIAGTPAGSEFTFSVFASKDSGTNAEEIELRLEKPDGAGTIVSQVFPVQEIKGGKWTKLSVTGTIPGEGVRVLVIVKPRADGERKGAIKFDDATLEVGGPKGDDSGVVSQKPAGGTAG